MPICTREDEAGAWHHVMNRGLAHRAIFETGADVRFFISRIARAVRRNEIELHAFSFLPTHYHLLVRSLRGDISRTMMWIQNQFVRWFNRRRHSDGPLFRGRFRSRRISSIAYWRTVVKYIDNNAVAGKLAKVSIDYPYGSARYYVKNASPAWLTRNVIEDEVRYVLGSRKYEPAVYIELFGGGCPSSQDWLVERRLLQRRQESDPLDHLVQVAPASIRRWLTRQGRIADGAKDDHVLVNPDTIMTEIAAKQTEDPGWCIRPAGRRISGWTVLRSGLLRYVSGLTYSEIRLRTGGGEASVCRHIRDHKLLLITDRLYCRRAADIINEAVRLNYDFPKPGANRSLTF